LPATERGFFSSTVWAAFGGGVSAEARALVTATAGAEAGPVECDAISAEAAAFGAGEAILIERAGSGSHAASAKLKDRTKKLGNLMPVSMHAPASRPPAPPKVQHTPATRKDRARSPGDPDRREPAADR